MGDGWDAAEREFRTCPVCGAVGAEVSECVFCGRPHFPHAHAEVSCTCPECGALWKCVLVFAGERFCVTGPDEAFAFEDDLERGLPERWRIAPDCGRLRP